MRRTPGILLATVAGMLVAAAPALAGRAPVNTALPTVTGTAAEGQMLTGQKGTWEGLDGYFVDWERCNAAGGECSAVSGALSETYVPVGADLGHTLKLAVVAKNAFGYTAARSAASAVVSAPRFFAASSFWNRPLAANAELDPSSAALVGEVNALVNTEVEGKWGPYISTVEYSTPIYTVPATQPTVRVTEDNEHGSATLQEAWAQVPIPEGAEQAKGRDAQLTVWQPSTGRLWEFWHASRQEDGWHAQWGGAIEHVGESAGYYSKASWAGAAFNWGATATSLPLVGGLVTLEDLQRGEIGHALSFSLTTTKAGVWSWPAQRTDGGGTGANNVPEGARFRLDPTLNVEALGLPPLVRMLALAAQRYGMVVHDKSGVVDFYGEDPKPGESNPWPGEFGSEAIWQALSRFPWGHLQALKMLLCSQQPCPVE